MTGKFYSKTSNVILLLLALDFSNNSYHDDIRLCFYVAVDKFDWIYFLQAEYHKY